MKDIEWKFETRKLDDLIENKDNPRRLSKKRAGELKKSLDKFGLCEPIVIQKNGKIIGGHQRAKTLRSLGIEEVHVAIPSRSLTEVEFKELSITLNKVTAEFDFDMLANRWEPEILLESGFTDEELHVDIEPHQKPKSLSITIKFENEDDLRKVEREISSIICDFPTANMKVRCK